MEHRPLLAFVSPLTHEATGIADYPAKLLPGLARHYEIVCVVDQPEVTDLWITAEFPTRNVRWFEENAGRFERILYQLSNSWLCKHMFRLLEQHPGVVVLHDFYLGRLLNGMADSGYAADSFTKALYDSHGFSALEKDRLDGRETSIGAFPCNATVLRASIGVIVHSGDAAELARSWYGERAFAAIRQLPGLSHEHQGANLSRPRHHETIATLYWDTIEEIYATSSKAWEQNLVGAIAPYAEPGSPFRHGSRESCRGAGR